MMPRTKRTRWTFAAQASIAVVAMLLLAASVTPTSAMADVDAESERGGGAVPLVRGGGGFGASGAETDAERWSLRPEYGDKKGVRGLKRWENEEEEEHAVEDATGHREKKEKEKKTTKTKTKKGTGKKQKSKGKKKSKKKKKKQSCSKNSDCSVRGWYCDYGRGRCDCAAVADANKATEIGCVEGTVSPEGKVCVCNRCYADPCMNKKAVCRRRSSGKKGKDGGVCALAEKDATSTTSTTTETPDSGVDTKLEQKRLNANLAKWKSFGPPFEHEYTFTRSCFCMPDYLGPFRVLSRGGKVVSVVRKDATAGAATLPGMGAKPPSDDNFDVPSIKDIFDKVQKALTDGVDALRVEYDSKYGFPKELFIDWSFFMADEETMLWVTDFVAIDTDTKEKCKENSDCQGYQVYCGIDSCKCLPHPPPQCGPGDKVVRCKRNTCHDFKPVCDEGWCELQKKMLPY